MLPIEARERASKFVDVFRQIRLISIAIIMTLLVILVLGLFVTSNYVNKEMFVYNIISFGITPILCGVSLYLKKAMMKKVTKENFDRKYFPANILPNALCELSGIVCIMTNLFLNSNIIFAVLGFAIAVTVTVINFPKVEDLANFPEGSEIKNVSQSTPR
jgi:hypothetical protein